MIRSPSPTSYFQVVTRISLLYGFLSTQKGQVKLIQRVKMAHSFTSEYGVIDLFDLVSHFRPTLKISCSVLLNLNIKL